RRRHTRFSRDWSSDVCSSDLADRARHQLARAAALEAVAGHIVHVAMEALLQPAQQARLLAAEIDVADTGLGEAELLGPVLDRRRSEERRVGRESRPLWSALHP